ncbi:hypothetical protein ACJJTC_018539 [Scirpophaga incertulas]
MSSKSCAGCDKLLPKYEYLRCCMCKAGYDLMCLNMSRERYDSFYATNNERKSSWKCPECLCKQPKRGNINTPVRSIAPTSGDVDVSPNTPYDESRNVTQRSRSVKLSVQDIDESNPITEISLYLNEMRAMRVQMSICSDTMAELTSTMKAQNKRLDSLESRMDALEAVVAESDRDEVKALQLTISQLKSEIQQRDQEMLLNDVEISNFPEIPNENTTHIILTVAKKLGVDLEERDVVRVERAGAVRVLEEGGPPPRPRPLVVRLARRSSRDALLRAARVRRGVTSEGMNIPGTQRTFYINERLTNLHRQLFQKTRAEAKRRNWKYVWTREGRIFARREQGSPAYRIKAELDLQKVFEINIVSAAL